MPTKRAGRPEPGRPALLSAVARVDRQDRVLPARGCRPSGSPRCACTCEPPSVSRTSAPASRRRTPSRMPCSALLMAACARALAAATSRRVAMTSSSESVGGRPCAVVGAAVDRTSDPATGCRCGPRGSDCRGAGSLRAGDRAPGSAAARTSIGTMVTRPARDRRRRVPHGPQHGRAGGGHRTVRSRHPRPPVVRGASARPAGCRRPWCPPIIAGSRRRIRSFRSSRIRRLRFALISPSTATVSSLFASGATEGTRTGVAAGPPIRLAGPVWPDVTMHPPVACSAGAVGRGAPHPRAAERSARRPMPLPVSTR